MWLNLILIIAIIALPALAQLYISITYKKYKEIKNSKQLSGFEVARKVLDANGLNDIDIVTTSGELTDHYDPRRKVVRLSDDIFNGTSIASLAVAAHECGHAVQDDRGYVLMRLRSILVPVVNIGTSLSYYIILIGFIFQILNLIYIGIALTGLGLLFQLVTLPVEIDASRRAGVNIRELGIAGPGDSSGARSVLTAAAMTYLAGVLASALQVARLLLIVMNRRD